MKLRDRFKKPDHIFIFVIKGRFNKIPEAFYFRRGKSFKQLNEFCIFHALIFSKTDIQK